MACAGTDLARIDRVRAFLERDRTVPAGFLPPVITASWRRCLELGLDPQAAPTIERASEPEIARRSGDVAEVLTLARGEMAELSRQLGTADFVLAFAAPDGMVLETLVAPSRRRDLEAMGIAPGAIWREANVGTNALGTASTTGSRITVRGPEHFFARHNRLTCIATPIFHPDRSLAGVLDASCPAERYAPRARAMVALAGAAIETRLFRMQPASAHVVTFHGRPEFLETPYAGLLSIDPSGCIDAANDQARFMLVGLGEPAGKDFDTVFTARLDMLAPGTMRRVTDSAGREFHLRLDGPQAVQTREPRAEPRRPPRRGGDLVVEDPAMAAAFDLAARAGQRRLPILLQGETGTGKDVTARATHAAARRAAGFFVLNGAGMPAEASGAADLISRADGGTLLLREVADFSETEQAALLRLLDEVALAPVGGASASADILVIATTSADLPAAVAAGRFRRDLYHRIAVAEVTLPALRDRSDFATLAETLLRGMAPETRIATDAIMRLAVEPWPGNIRELGNVLARLALVAPDGIGARDVATILASPPHRPAAARSQASPHAGGDAGPTLQEGRAHQIEAALRETGGNVSRAARRLGVSRNLIYRALASERRSRR